MKKALETSHLSWILSAFQASRMTAKNKSTKNQTFHLSSWSRPLRLSSWRGVASIGSIALLLAACGEDVTNENITQVVQDNLTIVSSTKELPKCTKDNEGAEAFVKGETSERICIDGKWTALASSKKDTVVVKDTVIVKDKSSCTTKELKDKSGVKIVCNGDSVGVVLNGKNGTDGKDGKDGTNGKNGSGCTVVTLADNSGLKVICGGDSVGVVLNGEKGDKGDPGKQGEKGDTGATGKNGSGCTMTQDEKKITITCGDKSSTINLSDIGSSITPDTTVVDSEKVAVSLDSLAGYTQKGPFIKGSTVYLYELMDGRSLKQTNGSFTSNITRDDGRFKFTARDLVSQYVMLIVDGNYRNEVTGKTSNSAIRLKAYSDVRRHATGTVNVNILTHLEFDRVYYLVTREKMTMKNAKRQAQQEIRKQFYIEQSDNTDAENLDVFGTTDADAALLAISILLQGERSEPEMMALLTEISNDMAEDGKWNGADADSVKAAIALWAMNNHGRLDKFRNNVKSWGLGEAPAFEKHIENFIEKSLGSVDCSGKKNGYKETVNKKFSPYDGKSFVCNDGVAVMERAENKYLNPDIQYGEFVDPRDKKVYKTVQIGVQTWMAENLNYADSIAYPELQNHSWCYNNNPQNCEIFGRLYDWGLAMDSAAIFSDDAKGCGYEVECTKLSYPTRGICPEGWHVPWGDDVRILLTSGGSEKSYMAKGFDVWPDATDKFGFSALPSGYAYGNNTGFYGGTDVDAPSAPFWEALTFTSGGQTNADALTFSLWAKIEKGRSFARNSGLPIRCVKNHKVEYGKLVDERDGNVYKTVKIGKYTWMAENLRYRYLEKTEDLDSSSFCNVSQTQSFCNQYGRLYLWSAAMDSAAVFSENGKGCGDGVTCTPTYPVRGVCPKGWHFPNETEWNYMLAAHAWSGAAYLAKDKYLNDFEWNKISDIYGFSLTGGEASMYQGKWSFATHPNGFFCSRETGKNTVLGGYSYIRAEDNSFSENLRKSSLYTVRCVQDK